MRYVSALCLFLLLAFTGCGKKVESVTVGEMNEYRDPAYGFKIKYPKEWKQFGTAGKALFCRSQEVANKFLDPSSGEEGAEVMVEVIRYEGKSPADLMQQLKDTLKQTWQNIQIEADQPLTVGGKQAVKVAYSIPVTSKTKIAGYQVYVPGDTAMYRLDMAGYGVQYEAHAAVLDTMLKSFEIPVVTAKKSDTWTASGNLETYTSNFFTLQYPDNLNFVPMNKGNKDLVMEMRADRQDCSIHIDVFGAQKLTVDKVWAQNKDKYKSKGTGDVTIDGNKAYWVDYSMMANVNSRAYFMVKNDKVIRATVNWFAPQKDVYFSVFEKCVNSMKLK